MTTHRTPRARRPRRTAAATPSLRLTPLESFILGAVLAVIYAVAANVSMSAHARDALIAIALIVGSVARPITAQQFLAKIPPELVTLIQAALGAIVILQQGWSLGRVAVTIIGVVAVIANTLGLGPAARPAA